MERRDFLKKGLGAGLLGATTLTFGGLSEVFAKNATNTNEAYDLVAVRNGDPVSMFKAGIESLGGMKTFVKEGQKVLVKPNIGWDVIPERAANTNPKLVGAIVKSCLEAGAKEVIVFDFTCDTWQNCYKNSGIGPEVEANGGKMIPGNSESYFKPADVPKGKSLKKVKVHEAVLNSDVFINVPVIKHHVAADMTLSMKNLMGVIWDRRWWHNNDLHQCIADYATYENKPHLNIIDGYRIMKQNGPRGVSEADVAILKAQIISTDMVAADAAAAKFFGKDPESINYIKIAHEMGVGNMDLEKLNINRIKL